MADDRIEHEIAHGKYLKDIWSGTLWYWETPAGKRRWDRRVTMLTSHITAGMEVLEIGCAVGYFTKEIVKSAAHVTAIDISPDFLEVAKKNVSSPNATFKVDNAYDLSFPDNSFDTIVGSSILHHLDIDKALKELCRVLKPGGTIYFTEPNMLNPQVFLERHTALFGYLIKKSPDETAFLRWRLKEDLKENGFTDIFIEPFDFLHPLTPRFMIPFVQALGTGLETIPLLREIAGSLYIKATKG